MDTLTLSTKEAAAWTGTSAEIIRRMIRDGRLPAVPVGRGPRSGYRIAAADLTRITRSRKRPLGSRVPSTEEADFVESAAPLFPDLPIPKLPPVRGSARELINYASTCQQLAEAALSRAARMLEKGGGTDGAKEA